MVDQRMSKKWMLTSNRVSMAVDAVISWHRTESSFDEANPKPFERRVDAQRQRDVWRFGLSTFLAAHGSPFTLKRTDELAIFDEEY